jgi:hypothetical protein
MKPQFFALLLIALSLDLQASAQDIRGIEVCTAEKDMTRRTGCLQANASLLQDLLNKEIRRAQAAESASAKEIASLKTELASLKASLEKAYSEIGELKKPKADASAKK